MDAIQKTIQRALRNKRNQRRFEPVLPQVEYKPKFRMGLAPFVPTKITFPDAMVVEGAGSDANYVYIRNGDNDDEPSKPKYEFTIPAEGGGFPTSGSLIWSNAPGSTAWVIIADSGGFPAYASNSDVPTPDLATGWFVANGIADAPTVRRATWSDIDSAGIDRSTVPLLE